MKKPSKTILCTGGAGFIGTNIVLECLRRGYEPIVLDNLSRAGSEDNLAMLEKLGVTVLRSDVTSTTVMLPFRVDAVIHLAANTGIGMSLKYPLYDFMQNAVGTAFMLDFANRVGATFIYASTNKVYAEDVNKIDITELGTRYTWDIDGVNESFATDGSHHTPYGVSKLTGDMYCQEYFHSFGTKTVVNRMSCIYGHYQNGAEEQGWVDHFVRSNVFGTGDVNIFGDGKQVRDVLWGADVARLYLDEVDQIDKCAGQVFNVGGGKDNTLSLIEAMDIISKETESDFNPTYSDWRDADQKIYISDISKVTSMLGWKPDISPKEGIHLMVERYKNEL